MEEKIINLNMDAKLIGIGIYSFIENCQLRNREGEKLLFRNVDQAILYATKVKKMTNPLDYDLNIVIGFKNEKGEVEESIISYDKFDFVNGSYQLYAEDGYIYNIKPVTKFSIVKMGYIVFNSNEPIEDVEAGKKISFENFENVKEAANTIIKFPNKPYTLKSIKRYYTNMALEVKNTTASINVMYNSQIMNVNQNRKNAGLRIFQFDTSMDKYNTLYIYIQTEYYEPDYFKPKTLNRCMNTLNCLMTELNKKRPDAKLHFIDIKCPITVDGNITVKHARKEDNKYDKSDKS